MRASNILLLVIAFANYIYAISNSDSSAFERPLSRDDKAKVERLSSVLYQNLDADIDEAIHNFVLYWQQEGDYVDEEQIKRHLKQRLTPRPARTKEEEIINEEVEGLSEDIKQSDIREQQPVNTDKEAEQDQNTGRRRLRLPNVRRARPNPAIKVNSEQERTMISERRALNLEYLVDNVHALMMERPYAQTQIIRELRELYRSFSADEIRAAVTIKAYLIDNPIIVDYNQAARYLQRILHYKYPELYMRDADDIIVATLENEKQLKQIDL